MTTTNGSRVVEHIVGVVQSANEHGVHLAGEDDWRNFSKWAQGVTLPARGQHVRLGLDGAGFVRELQVLDEYPPVRPKVSDLMRKQQRRGGLANPTFLVGHGDRAGLRHGRSPSPAD